MRIKLEYSFVAAFTRRGFFPANRRRVKRRWLNIVCLLSIGLMVLRPGPVVWAQPPWLHDHLTQELANPDRTVAVRAFHQISRDMPAVGPPMEWLLLRVWPTALMRGRHYNLAARLELQTICNFPGNLWVLQGAMDLRVRALLRANHPRQALSAARGLLNICSMRMTQHALLLVGQCLNAAFPQDPQMVENFMDQQVAGAVPVAPGGKAQRCMVLESIPLHGRPFASTLRDLQPFADYQSLLARGNLLLLSGKAAEAMGLFRLMANQYGDGRTANECMARALKAEDGTVGRANGFVLSLMKSATITARRGGP